MEIKGLDFHPGRMGICRIGHRRCCRERGCRITGTEVFCRLRTFKYKNCSFLEAG